MYKLWISEIYSISDTDIYDYFRCINIPLKSFIRVKPNSGTLYFDDFFKKEKALKINNCLIKNCKVVIEEVAHCNHCKMEGHRDSFCRFRSREVESIHRDNSPRRKRSTSPIRRSERDRSRSPKRYLSSRPPEEGYLLRSLPKEGYSPDFINYQKFGQEISRKFKIRPNHFTGDLIFDCKNDVNSLIDLERWYNYNIDFISKVIGKKLEVISLQNKFGFELNNTILAIYSVSYTAFLKMSP